MKLNVGSGMSKIKGYKTLDINKDYNPDIIADITKKIPLKSGSVDEIVCFHVLEHINPENLNLVIKEFWRILKNNGRLHIKVPHFTATPYELHYFHARMIFLRDYYMKTNSFKLVKRRLNFSGRYKIFENIINKMPFFYENSFLRSFIFAKEVELVLEANKNIDFTDRSGSH